MPKLHKVIAAAGVCSRRAAELLIRAGAVTVNGEQAHIGMVIAGGEAVLVKGKPLPKPITVCYLFHKPKGVVSSRIRQGKNRIVQDYLPSTPAVYPIGRLDKDTTGLILVTNDGDLTQRIVHPTQGVQKVYSVQVRVKENRAMEQSLKKLSSGVKLGDGRARADAVEMNLLSSNLYRLTITIHEGRTHLVRRLCAAAGFDVVSLHRSHIAHLSLRGVPQGGYRVLQKQDLKPFYVTS
jgi:23S rRNA pseudouridine2605 synthase